MILPGIVLALVGGTDGPREVVMLAARVAAFVLIGRYLLRFARQPGWLPGSEAEGSRRRE